jgi:EAL domain-containing protein (putative c-di-GMP-specific phosphodiesterase class I)/CRP-like cAMP-binding protein
MVNERARLLPLAPGEILFAQGEPSDALYLVAAGRLAVLLPNEVARLERGDFFGEEVAVLPGRPRLCTLKAVEPCQVLWLGRDLVEDLVAETPALLAILEARLRERLLVMLAHSSPMLGSLPPAERLTLLRRFHFLEVGPGQAVEEAGASPGLFVLLAGMAAIAVDGETLAELEPGDTFGETALAGDVSGRLSATASERCFFLHLPGADLSGLPVRYPGMAAHLTAVAEQRLRQAEAFLATRAPPPSPAAASARLLLVHVDPVASRSYQEAFTAAGFQVDLASTAEPARRLIGGGRYDVVLCSVETLVHTGADLLGAVRRSDLDVPILLLARDARPDTAAMATRYGVVESFVEPLDAGRLLRTAVRAVHLHRLTRLRREARSLLDPSGEWMGDRAGLELHFGTALRGLWMAFQPIISVSARQVYAFEALLRSREAVLGSPVAVLRAAERLQRVHDVGRIARDCVAETARGAGATPTLFVNLHGQDLLDQHLLDPAARLSAIASQVVLELTERTPLDQLADLGDRLAALRALGYRFAISNLGAGHAALGSLAQLAPDVAKLDIALVRGIDEDSARQNLVAGMIGVCQDMNIPVVCGGVETAPERDTLMRLGADLMQGYLFARPGPPFPAVDPTAIGGSR